MPWVAVEEWSGKVSDTFQGQRALSRHIASRPDPDDWELTALSTFSRVGPSGDFD